MVVSHQLARIVLEVVVVSDETGVVAASTSFSDDDYERSALEIRSHLK